ncbi:MAG: response regulator [Deltaproteobacteria bacterium]|nr:response regulator [Deltaproteobacteria bacterium]
MHKKIGKALVVGAGIGGIRAALDLAETGYGVTLIDKSPHIGGILSKLDYQFPTNHCGMCKMLPLVDRDKSSQYCLRKGLFHENIEILLSTELIAVDGEAGQYTAQLKQRPNWVDANKCIGCALCVDACPVEVPDEFNEGMSKRKAIYLPVPHAIPNPFIIDMAACTRCGECEKICPTGAIRLSEQARSEFKILVVDDELIVRDSLKELLGEEGFAVQMAASGSEALEKLDVETYHLMLTDIKMPGMDGVELLGVAKEKCPDLTVIMMTAYATVETAVEAMKIGALDYLIKPFDPDKMIPMLLDIYADFEAAGGLEREVGAIVLCGGTDYYRPETGKNAYGYGIIPNVVTSMEFERMLSGLGPAQGRLVRPSDGKPVRNIGWIQCVGSRDLQSNADFCSSICCMHAIKEALLAKEKSTDDVETTLFYMDMRTFEKSFQRYRDSAEKTHGVRFLRGRVHSTEQNVAGDVVVRYAEPDGTARNMSLDLMVLSLGQRPAKGADMLANMLDLGQNQWGFLDTLPFYATRTQREGVFIGGAFSGLTDISNSVIQSSAAALAASSAIHSSGGGLAPEVSSVAPLRDVSRERPEILVILCTCDETLSDGLDVDAMANALQNDPSVKWVERLRQACTETGWNELTEHIKDRRPNRVVIGACRPYVYARKLNELSKATGLPPSLMDVVDIRTPLFGFAETDPEDRQRVVLSALKTGIAGQQYADPAPVPTCPVRQKALVVGGGIAGLTAALGIADHGFRVDVVEKSDELGGNLNWMKNTIEGHDTASLLEETVARVHKHRLIDTHTASRIVSSFGDVGSFFTTIQDEKGVPLDLQHGVTVLATGGCEAPAESYAYGRHDGILTQKEFACRLASEQIDPAAIDSVVMIQCVGSREAPRNYCSRICCAASLKYALQLKAGNPGINIYVLYRDMMAFGFLESYYTSARKAGVVFIQYHVDRKPVVHVDGGKLSVTTVEPIIGRPIEIKPNLVILATGIVPNLTRELAAVFDIAIDPDGFFQEAEPKWRPVDAIKEGVFACGLTHSPRSVTESIATAEAAAERCLRILTRHNLPSGKLVAQVRHNLCSLCERCIDACPYGARALDMDKERVEVNPVMCQGCGSCAAVCPNDASILAGFPKQQMFQILDAAVI